MNLRALQHADINVSLTAAIDNERYRSYSTRLQGNDASSGAGHVLIEQSDHDCSHGTEIINTKKKRIVQARPAFSDSLLSTEILLSVPCTIGSESPNSAGNTKHNYPIDALDYPSTNNLQYRLHDPLPEYLSGHLYRAGLHTVVIIDDEHYRNVHNVTLAVEAHQKLHSTARRQNTSQQSVTPCFIDGNATRRTPVKHQGLETLQLEPYRLTHTCHRLNVISKADLVLCDSAGTAVDAIRSGVPAVFLADTPIGFENVQYAVEAFLRNGTSEQLLVQQQNALNVILKNHCSDHYVMSNHSTLVALIHDQLTTTDPQLKNECDPHFIDPTSDDLILCTQQTLRGNQNTATRLKTGVERSRRKFQKFRESPSRFMKDSQIRVLRSLAATRIQ